MTTRPDEDAVVKILIDRHWRGSSNEFRIHAEIDNDGRMTLGNASVVLRQGDYEAVVRENGRVLVKTGTQEVWSGTFSDLVQALERIVLCDRLVDKMREVVDSKDGH